METGQVSIALSREATTTWQKRPEDQREKLLARLRDLARHPERSISSPGSELRRAVYKTGDGVLYAIVFTVDEPMRRQARVPAIAVKSIKNL